MKAIVLSCDRYHKITDHMITTYQDLWPSNQLKFLIPYNEKYPKFLEDKWGEKVEFVKTPVEFKETINGLLKNVDDDEWVYWATDDSYLVDLNEEAANNTYDFVTNIQDDSIYSVIFYYGIYDKANNIVDRNDFIIHNEYKFLRKKKITYQWQHQFCRAKVIKKMFECFDEPDYPKEMDHMLKESSSDKFWNMTNIGKWYVTERNSVIMAEPTSRGNLTKNGLESFKKYKLEAPLDEFEVGDRIIIKE
jgi:hypothetical protein